MVSVFAGIGVATGIALLYLAFLSAFHLFKGLRLNRTQERTAIKFVALSYTISGTARLISSSFLSEGVLSNVAHHIPIAAIIVAALRLVGLLTLLTFIWWIHYRFHETQ